MSRYCLRCAKLARVNWGTARSGQDESAGQQEVGRLSTEMTGGSFGRFGQPMQRDDGTGVTEVASEGEDGRDCFLVLIGIYLSDNYARVFPSEAGPSSVGRLNAVDRAKGVLDTFACFIDPIQIFKDLDDQLPVAKLEEFLTQALPRTIHKRRHNQAVKGISRMNYLQTQLKYNEARSVVIDITAETRCPVCEQPVGESIFSLHPSFSDPDSTLASSSNVSSYNSVGQSQSPHSQGKNYYVITHYKCATKYRRGLRQARASQEKLRLERHQSTTNQTYL